MKIGQQYYDHEFGYGIVSEITTAGFTVKFYKNTVFYPHVNREKLVAISLWFCIIVISVLTILNFII
jgi:hypothetical protein